MKEVVGDIWDFHAKGNWIVITTNGTVKSNGEAVMGRGVTLQAKQRFPNLSHELGKLILRNTPTSVISIVDYRLFSFPVKFQ